MPGLGDGQPRFIAIRLIRKKLLVAGEIVEEQIKFIRFGRLVDHRSLVHQNPVLKSQQQVSLVDTGVTAVDIAEKATRRATKFAREPACKHTVRGIWEQVPNRDGATIRKVGADPDQIQAIFNNFP